MNSTQLILYGPQIAGIIIIAGLIGLNGGDRRGRLFVGPMLLLALWLGAQLGAQIVQSDSVSLFLIRLSAVLSCLIAVAYYFVIHRYLGRSVRLSNAVVVIGATVAICTLAMTNIMIRKASGDSAGIIIEDATPLYDVLLLYVFVIFGTSLTLLFRATRHLMPHDRSRNNILFFATLQIVVLSGLGSTVFPHVAAAQIFIFVSALVFCIAIFFGIIRHGLFDVRLIAVRTLGYTLSLLTLALVYLLLAYVLSRLFFQSNFTNDVSFSPVNIALALLLAFIFQPVKNFFDRITNRVFYRDRYSVEEFYGTLSNVLSTTTNLNGLLSRAADVVSETLKSEQAFFYIRTGERSHIIAGTQGHGRLLVSEADHLDELVKKTGKQVLQPEQTLGNKTLSAILLHHKIAVLLPLYHDGAIMGYFSLGQQLAGSYRKRDLKVLETIADELVIAIQNAMSLEEVRAINATLQQRIDGATRDLRSKNERLKELDNTKDEFISMASHQLRTPLTSVKGYISMILDGDAGTVTDSQRRFLEEAFDSSVRMAGIIGDFLNVSRLQTGKFMLEKSEVNLAEIAESEVEHLQNTARMRGLTIHYKKPSHFPLVTADKSKIEQVMMNFMDNALFYAPNSKTVEVELKEDGGKAIFTVRDHGIGVPKQEQAGLFTKFFRATNARKQRPDGTGVGIFLAKKVITAHHGDIIFESEEGKGSTFGFTLPLLNETAR